jgi:hypothetical protein
MYLDVSYVKDNGMYNQSGSSPAGDRQDAEARHRPNKTEFAALA